MSGKIHFTALLCFPNSVETLYMAHHTYCEHRGKKIIGIIDYTVEKRGKDGKFKPCKATSKDAVKFHIENYLRYQTVQEYNSNIDQISESEIKFLTAKIS